VLRVIVLAFRRDDPRRRELLAELHAVPRIERPLWVAEQLEVAVFEGLWPRTRLPESARLQARTRFLILTLTVILGGMAGLVQLNLAVNQQALTIQKQSASKPSWPCEPKRSRSSSARLTNLAVTGLVPHLAHRVRKHVVSGAEPNVAQTK
jgi:hypothetical protein